MEQQIATISTIPLNQRGTIRSTSAALRIPATTLHRRLQQGEIRAHSSAVKPQLTGENMTARMKLCRQHIDTDSRIFEDMMDVVHVDEKCFL